MNQKKINRPPLLYGVGRFVLSPIYKHYYQPIIIGKENIPKEGPIILAGNHIHLYDQCNSIISSKRFLTYMAKKEYFDSKKTRWFFKSVGCIPVDRTSKDTNAVESALEVLEKGGAVGIFPEGTRNALKEDRIKTIYEDYFKEKDFEEFNEIINSSKPKLSQIKFLEQLYLDKKINKSDFLDYLKNPDISLKKLVDKKIISKNDYYDSLLLPLKFGAVSMASKTNATIVPVAVIGDYRFHSKNLKIKFGTPFRVKNMDLEKANNKLRSELIKEIKFLEEEV